MNKTKKWGDFYNSANRLILQDSPAFNFMNHGYSPAYEDYAEQYFSNQCSLYHHMLLGIPTENKRILEIGCGRGGGISTFSKYNFASITGCDISAENIKFCKSQNSYAEYIEADAIALPFENDKFDVVINVESSHCYEDKTKFLNEVCRVLTNDGVFLYTDCSVSIEQPLANKCLFKYIYREDITSNVTESTKKDFFKFSKMQDSGIKTKVLSLTERAYFNYLNNNWNYIKYVCTNNKEILKKAIVV